MNGAFFKTSGIQDFVEMTCGIAEHAAHLTSSRTSDKMNEEFEPRNELEKSLLAAQEEIISSDDLLNILMNSQVFMPVQDEKPSLLNIQRLGACPAAGAG